MDIKNIVVKDKYFIGGIMVETDSLRLDKAKFSDWKEMYNNVWSKPQSAKYMYGSITTSEKTPKSELQKLIEFQEKNDTYLVYESQAVKRLGLPA